MSKFVKASKKKRKLRLALFGACGGLNEYNQT